ncbi:hypothetical protein PGT21_025487 [Puccinia graminis f. sp. tritici]|uniref:Uncharacterized protein n=1 Tax=Puccinia graminis f. sp. tritici TaxID=56615 RepID=A0A5B0N4S7_PUCGR|nr:hypothetical protein PGT21_025487 [Puccinia graminis f. sp. tritici]
MAYPYTFLDGSGAFRADGWFDRLEENRFPPPSILTFGQAPGKSSGASLHPLTTSRSKLTPESHPEALRLLSQSQAVEAKPAPGLSHCIKPQKGFKRKKAAKKAADTINRSRHFPSTRLVPKTNQSTINSKSEQNQRPVSPKGQSSKPVRKRLLWIDNGSNEDVQKATPKWPGS